MPAVVGRLLGTHVLGHVLHHLQVVILPHHPTLGHTSQVAAPCPLLRRMRVPSEPDPVSQARSDMVLTRVSPLCIQQATDCHDSSTHRSEVRANFTEDDGEDVAAIALLGQVAKRVGHPPVKRFPREAAAAHIK